MSDTPDVPPRRPAGFVPVGDGATLRATRPLAWVVVITIGLVTVVTVASCVQSFRRASTWRDGGGVLPTTTAHHLDEVASRCFWAALAVILLSAIALAIWGRLVVGNANRRGVTRLRPGVVTFAWFIPLFGIGPAVNQLIRSVDGVGYSPHRLARWKWSAFIMFLVVVFAQFVSRSTWVRATTIPDKLDALDTSNIMYATQTIWMVVSAVIAIIAVFHADRSVSNF
jgi:hypothetical protein